MPSFMRFKMLVAFPMLLMIAGIMAVAHAESSQGFGRAEEAGGAILFILGLILMPVLLRKFPRE